MGAIEFDKSSERNVQTGVSKGILYLRNEGAYSPWDGLISVSENSDGAEETSLYADNQKYGSFRSSENYNATIEAYSYPEDFLKCNGRSQVIPGLYVGQQSRERFDFCFRTEIYGSNSANIGYKIHLIYNATITPSDESFSTVNDSPDASSFSWDLSTLPFVLKDYKPTSKIEIDSTKVDRIILKDIETILYGLGDTEPVIPSPEEVIEILEKNDLIRPVIDILSSHEHWLWDTFNFNTDSVPSAIEKESLRHIFYNPDETVEFIQPSVVYYFISENSYGVRHYKFMIIDSHYPSQLATDIEEALSLTKTSTKHEGDFYYYSYDLFV